MTGRACRPTGLTRTPLSGSAPRGMLSTAGPSSSMDPAARLGAAGLSAGISVGAEVVVWDQFYCHGALDLTDALRFEFAADQYRSRLAAFDAIPRVGWKA